MSLGEHRRRGTRSEQQLQLYFAGERKQRSFSFVNDKNSSSPCILIDTFDHRHLNYISRAYSWLTYEQPSGMLMASPHAFSLGSSPEWLGSAGSDNVGSTSTIKTWSEPRALITSLGAGKGSWSPRDGWPLQPLTSMVAAGKPLIELLGVQTPLVHYAANHLRDEGHFQIQ